MQREGDGNERYRSIEPCDESRGESARCAIFIPKYFIHASNYFEHTAYVSAKNFCIVVLHNCWFLSFLCLPQLTFTVKVNTRSVGNQTSILCIDDGNMKNRPLPYSAPKIKIKQKYLDLHSYYIFTM